MGDQMTARDLLDVEVDAQAQALAHVDLLEQLLEEEFDALKVQDLDRFEHLLQQKNELLTKLSDITGVRQPEDAHRLGDEWDLFRTRMLTCRSLHQRNEILIIRKLDAIRGALDSLQVTDPTSTVEVYDRLGRVDRLRRRRGYSDV